MAEEEVAVPENVKEEEETTDDTQIVEDSAEAGGELEESENNSIKDTGDGEGEENLDLASTQVVEDNEMESTDDKGGGDSSDQVPKVESEENEEDELEDDTQPPSLALEVTEDEIMDREGEEEEGEEEEENDGELKIANDDDDEMEELVEEEQMEEGDPGVKSAEGGNQDSVPSGAGGVVTRKRTLSQSSGEDGPRRKVGRSISTGGGGGIQSSDGGKHDKFCWVCHKDGIQVNCKLCPRSYHAKCMSMDYPNAKIGDGDSSCPCPECVVVMNAETIEFRSDSMKQLTLDQLMGLLKNVCVRMRQTPGADPFVKPVDPNEAEDYFDYIVYPMDIETLEKNIKKRQYGSTEAFMADAQWIVHNSIVFNSASSQYTQYAKRLLKICKQELQEIETCPECYQNAHEKSESWFLEACRRPHILVWAKLKGFPFWPAKAMKIKDNDVDVRFFGQHDRAWVSMKDCFLYSEEMPVGPKKNNHLTAAIEELTAHVEKLKEKHGPVVFSPVKTSIGPQLSVEQIRRMLPEYNPPDQQTSKGQATTSSTTATNNKAASTNSSSNNNNNNNNTKVPQPLKKSPMTIRISSLKTNPTIVNNSAVTASAEENAGAASSENRVTTRLTRKSSAAAQQQNQSLALSESDHSTDEAPNAPEANATEDNADADNVPDNATNGTDEESSAPVPKGSEILANALGGPLRRSTRGQSRSGDGSTSHHQLESLVSGASAQEKRLTRSSVKGGSSVDGGNETDESSGQVGEEQPPDSVLEAMGLSKKTAMSNQKPQVKGEPLDMLNDTDGEINSDLTIKTSHKNSQALVEQLTAQSTAKTGYRFNLSKDISISAVDGGGATELGDDYETNHMLGPNIRVKRTNAPIMGQQHQQRAVPQSIPIGMGGVRPRVQSNVGTSILNGQQQPPRTFTGQQLRQMVRNARPQHILNPRTGQRITGVPQNRPVSLLNVNVRGQQHQLAPKNTKDNAAVDPSLVNPVQGPITLPGGTITVTPLSLMNAGIINVQQQSSGGTTIVNNAATGSKSIKGGMTSVQQQRRNLMTSIPPSVSLHLQNLTKTMGELMKSTVEQITLEVIEYCNNTQGKAEVSKLQMELERVQNKLKQEVTDVKHNNDIALRELRITMENDKKRAIAEIKRQMEVEKLKAVEETKKKQWCASCGREALFYCCWNTSYCGYPCQEEHWPSHMASCSQSSSNSR